MKRAIRVLSSKTSDAYLVKGELFLEKSHPYRSLFKYQRALQYFNQALYFAPIKSAQHYAKIAEAYFYLEENHLSVHFANKAVSLDADCLLAYEMLHINSDNDVEIIEYCQQMVRLKPDDGFAYLMWGKALRRNKRLEEAKEVLYRGMAQEPFLGIIRELAMIEYRLGNQEIVAHLFSDYIQTCTRGFAKEYALNALAHFYLETSQMDKVVDAFMNVINNANGKRSIRSSAYIQLAEIYEANQYWQDAIGLYKKVIKNEKFSIRSAHLGIRRCYIALGKTDVLEKLEQLMIKRFSKKITEEFDV